jgi:acyl-homoserine lactone acylase PvdQ
VELECERPIDPSGREPFEPLGFAVEKIPSWRQWGRASIVVEGDWQVEWENTEGKRRIDPPLGEFQRLRRGKADLPLCGGPEALRAIIGDIADDGRRVGNNGDGFIMLIEWARDGQVASHSVHQFGAATMRPASPHYADQAPLFAAEQWKRVEFDRAATPTVP